MPGFLTYQQIRAAQEAGQTRTYNFWKTAPTVAEAASTWQSYWFGGVTPSAGATVPGPPGTTYVNVSTSMTFPDVSPARKFITKIGVSGDTGGTVMIYDRLVAVGALELDVTTPVNTATVPRYNGAGVQAWVELISGPITAGGRLQSYTNQDGVAGRAGSSLTLTEVSVPNASTMFGPLPLQAGDTGIRSVQTFQGTSSATTAQCSMVLLRPLLFHPVSTVTGWMERDLVLEGMLLPEIYDGASLCIAYQSLTATTPTIWGQVEVTWA